jgi:peptidoglycan hydrolase CwlO-like protein
MKKLAFIAALFLSGFMISCSPNAESEETNQEETTETSPVEEARENVMALHDEVMAKMNTMGKLRSELGTMQDTLNPIAEIDSAIVNLQNAHDDMMNWMGDFQDIESQTDDESAILKYYNEEYQKMAKIATDTEKAIAEAEAILGEQ